MDSINTRMNTMPAPVMKKATTMKDVKNAASPELGDKFAKTVKFDVGTKPVFRNSNIVPPKEALGVLGGANTALASAIASAGSGPIYKSIAGSIAKWLISDEQEVKIGEMMTKQIESQFIISKDPKMNERVQRVGKQIAANSKRPNLPYTFKVIEEPSINAFAGPGGKIYVHSGLLKQFPSDDHLAFILGHEMGHVENRDSIDRIGVQFVLSIIQVVLGRTQGKLDDLLGLAVGKLYDAQVSQKAEYAADRRGADHMKALGYDPKEGAAALRGLESAGRREPGAVEQLFLSHPPTEERAVRVEKYAKKIAK